MPKTSAELLQTRASKITAQGELLSLVQTEDRNLTSEEQVRFDTLDTEITGLDTQIESVKRQEAAAKRAADLVFENQQRSGGNQGGSGGSEKIFSISRSILNLVDNEPLDDEAKRVHARGRAELNQSGIISKVSRGICVPSFEMRDYSVTGDSGTKGGSLVPTEIRPQLPHMPSLKLRDLGCDVITGAVGKLSFPTTDNLSFAFYEENEKVSGQDTTFDGPIAEPKRLSGVINISRQMLLQTNADAILMKMIYNSIDNTVFTAAFEGDGNKAPLGLYDAITTNDLSGVGAGELPTMEHIIKLKSAVKAGNVPQSSMGYVFDTEVEGQLELTKKDAGSGLYLIENGKLIGRKYLESSLVPTLASGTNRPIIYGAWSALKYIQWSGVELTVDSVTNADAGMVKLTVNFYCDALVTNEKAFAIKKDVLIA